MSQIHILEREIAAIESQIHQLTQDRLEILEQLETASRSEQQKLYVRDRQLILEIHALETQLFVKRSELNALQQGLGDKTGGGSYEDPEGDKIEG
jgi:hypothetical protein